MDYIEGMIWYGLWPVVIFVSVKFVQHNVKHFQKCEAMEQLHKKNERY